MTNARVQRGRSSEDLVAEWYRAHGWPDAERIANSRGGADIRKMLYLAPEVKARSKFEPLAWARQASKNADGRMPFVIMRCNGQGAAQIRDWIVMRRLVDDTFLLEGCRDNGYLELYGED